MSYDYRILVFDRSCTGFLDAGRFRNGGNRIYESKKRRQHYNEKPYGFLYRYGGFFTSRLYPYDG